MSNETTTPMVSRDSADSALVEHAKRTSPKATAHSMFLEREFPGIAAVVREVMTRNADHSPWRATPASEHLEKALAHVVRVGRDFNEPHAAHALTRMLMWFATLEAELASALPPPKVREHVKQLRPLMLSMGFSDRELDILPTRIGLAERIAHVGWGNVVIRAVDGSARTINHAELK